MGLGVDFEAVVGVSAKRGEGGLMARGFEGRKAFWCDFVTWIRSNRFGEMLYEVFDRLVEIHVV